MLHLLDACACLTKIVYFAMDDYYIRKVTKYEKLELAVRFARTLGSCRSSFLHFSYTCAQYRFRKTRTVFFFFIGFQQEPFFIVFQQEPRTQFENPKLVSFALVYTEGFFPDGRPSLPVSGLLVRNSI